MSSIWEKQEETFLYAAGSWTLQGKKAPENSRVFAFRPDGNMTGLWFGGETVGWGKEENPSCLLMAHTGVWTMRFAVREVFPASYPGKPELFMLGACASVDLYPGAGLALRALQQEAACGERVKYRDVYPALQPEMEAVWRSAAQEFCGGSAWTRLYWLSRMDEVLQLVQRPAAELLVRHGLFPAGNVRLDGLAPVTVSRP